MLTGMTLEAIGWIAVALNVAAYAVKTMIPLRVLALGSHAAFILFGLGNGVTQTLVLSSILAVLNVWRLWELAVLTRRIRRARTTDFDLDLLKPLLTRRKVAAGAHVFRKGDAPDHFYILGSGRILLEEAGIELSDGEVFGEIGFFSHARERTLSAVCVTDCELFAVDEANLMKVYYQNPDFALYIVRLISRRLLEGTSAKPEAYRVLARAEADPPPRPAAPPASA